MSQASNLTAMTSPTPHHWLAMPLASGMTREWSWLLGVAMIDLLWCWYIGITFSRLYEVLLTMAIAMLACLGCRQFQRARRLADACEAVAFWIGLSAAGCILTYLFATWAFPLQDVLFDRMDAALGFDWLAWKQFVTGHPPLHRLLSLVYATLRLQVLLVVIIFALAGRSQRNTMLFRSAFISLMITTIISGFVPALGAFGLYDMPAEAPWLHDLLALRDGVRSFAVPSLQGVIDMPSYHAILAILLAWSFRGGGLVGVTMGLWNLLMLISVLSEGGHYLVDAIAGFGVAAASLWLARASLSAERDTLLNAPAGARRP